MVSLRSDVRQAVASNRLRVAGLGTGELTTDIPEYADLYGAFPDTDWKTLRGIGATRARTVASAGEENLICLPSDVFAGESVLVWVLAQALRDLGIVEVDAQFESREQSAYTRRWTAACGRAAGPRKMPTPAGPPAFRCGSAPTLSFPSPPAKPWRTTTRRSRRWFRHGCRPTRGSRAATSPYGTLVERFAFKEPRPRDHRDGGPRSDARVCSPRKVDRSRLRLQPQQMAAVRESRA
jgi:hypothetical protein